MIDLEDVNHLLFKYEWDENFGVREFHAAILEEVSQRYPFVIENRVVKGPAVALVEDEETAEIFTEVWMDLRVIPFATAVERGVL